MFTGIVEEVGVIKDVEELEGSRVFKIEALLVIEDSTVGSSIALDGACHTLIGIFNDGFAVNSIGATLEKTVGKEYRKGSKINLERPVMVGTRLDGHLVQGHVDGTGEISAIEDMGQYHLMDIKIPEEVMLKTLIAGSITINGVSLTVNDIVGHSVCQVAVIPFTWANTNLREQVVGSQVNIEGDLVGKYIYNFQKPA